MKDKAPHVDRINLYPKDLRPAQTELKMVGAALGAVAVVALLGFTGLQNYKTLRALEVRESDVSARLDNIRRQVAALPSPDQKKTSGPSRGDVINKFIGKHFRWNEAMRELSVLTLDGVWLSSFTGETDDGEDEKKGGLFSSEKDAKKDELKILLSGEAGSPEHVSRYLSLLEESFFFRDIKIKFSEQLVDIEPSLYRFQLDCTIPTKGPGKEGP